MSADKNQKNISFDIESSESEISIVDGDGLFRRRKKVKKSKILKKAKDKVQNFFSKRDYKLLPIQVRNNLNAYGNETITSIKIVRTPIEKAINGLLSVITRNQYNKAVKSSGYDSMFHLALFINQKYLFDKQEVVHFEKTNPIKSNSETIDIHINKDITIQTLIEETKKYMGDVAFNGYDAFENNCQDFIIGILKANDLDYGRYIDFVKQDANSILQKLPKYTKKVSKFLTDVGAVAEKILHGASTSGTDIIKSDGEKTKWKDFVKMKTTGKKFQSREDANNYMRQLSKEYKKL